ncbi:5153_t:CDS:2 [Entrophospora sp. SA101]|nr:5153_t:CDS:2 [Entrophospora sp. SA101]CAJ0831834.1 13895_t:CDS:2 [Entrophospora sp. SA101]CAJ0915369.1 17056_t:CDS:2 [Entrophospora sp. SA101]CAJ0915393.1 17063_t:CDS:2 [Entrophospora sp. SA101]
MSSKSPFTISTNKEKSMVDNLKEILIEYEATIKQFFASIASSTAEGKSQTEHTPVKLMKNIVELDKKMQKSLDQIEEHQKVHNEILQVENELELENSAILELVNALKEGKKEFESSLENADTTIQAINFANKFTADEILKYAAKLSKYTSAPSSFNNQNANIPLQPPYPDETLMRAGLLFRQYDDGEIEEFDSMDVHKNINNSNNNPMIVNETTASSYLQTNQIEQQYNLDLNPDLE